MHVNPTLFGHDLISCFGRLSPAWPRPTPSLPISHSSHTCTLVFILFFFFFATWSVINKTNKYILLYVAGMQYGSPDMLTGMDTYAHTCRHDLVCCIKLCVWWLFVVVMRWQLHLSSIQNLRTYFGVNVCISVSIVLESSQQKFIHYLLLPLNTIVSRVSAHGRLNITHDFGPHGCLPGI